MIDRQRGVLNLYWVAILSALLAALAMAAIYSMRHERNVFAEGWAQLVGASGAREALDTARKAVAGNGGDSGGGVMRKCVIEGKTVISNTECAPGNPTSRVIKIHDTRGFEAPKQVAPAEAPPTSVPEIDKIIEKQLR
ncbi:MAG: DUF4124 domain-containing protein [Telluria sp.]|nr:DUF4124 domain-containing protein [Telluria sp.]